MRCLRVTAELRSLCAPFTEWSLCAACGHGPTARSAASAELADVSVDIPFSSPSTVEGEVTLQFYGHSAEGSDEERKAGVLVATKKVTVANNKSTHALDLRLKPSAGDVLDTTSSVMFAWLPAVSHTTAMTTLLMPHIALATSVEFSSMAIREDLSLRILNAEGVCLAAGNIPSSGTPSTVLLLSEKYHDKTLELSVAGESTGVFCTLLILGDPLVCKVAAGEDGDGCLLLSTRMHLHTRTLTANSVEGEVQQNDSVQMLSFGAVRHQPNPEREITSPPSSVLVYHVECLNPVGSSSDNVAAQDESFVPGILSRVVQGPLLSRVDLPKTSSCGLEQNFIVASSFPMSAEVDASASLQEFQTQHLNSVLFSKHNLTANGSLTVRLSILVVPINPVSAEDDDPGPCATFVGSCLLTEVHCSQITTEDGTSLRPEFGTIDKKSFVLLRGVIENISDIPSAVCPVGIGDTFELAYALLSLTAPVVEVPHEETGDEQLFDLRSNHSTTLEPVAKQDSSQHSSTQSLLNELGRILQKDDEPKTDTQGSEMRLVDVLTNELQEKQRLVDRLLNENSAKSQTIAEQTACGDSLRQEISKLKVSLTETRAALSYREQESSAAVRLAEDGIDSPASLQQFSRPVLVQAVIECCNRLKQKDQECIDLKKVMGDSVSIRKQYIALTKKYKDLQDAHLMQSKHIQKMQKQHERVKTYQNTIVMQEKVISKMQSVIESHLRTSIAPSMSASLPSKHGIAPNTRHGLGSAASHDTRQLHEGMKMSRGEKQASAETESELAKLRAEISSKDIRIDALQEQLTISATEASREIANLRTRLFELEISGIGSSVSGDYREDDGSIGSGEEGLSSSLSRDLLLVPFQQSLQKDNEHLRLEILSARSRSSTSLQSGGGNNAPMKSNIFPELLVSHTARSREAPSSIADSFLDLSGTTHRESPPVRTKSISLSDAYRANSVGGSPRPRSPSDMSSSTTPSSVRSGRRVKSVTGDVKSDSGQDQPLLDELQHDVDNYHSKVSSRLSSKVNSRVNSTANSRVSSKSNSRVHSPASSVNMNPVEHHLASVINDTGTKASEKPLGSGNLLEF